VTLDPRTPIIVGVGQVNQRDRAAEPIELMARSVESALADADPGNSLRERVAAVRVVYGVWPYRDPGRLVADRAGLGDVGTSITTPGGNQVYELVLDTAARVARGELDVAVVCAAEAMRTRRHDRGRGESTAYLDESAGAAPDDVLGDPSPMTTAAEDASGVNVPVVFYALAEQAIRARTGESVVQHRQRIAAMWSDASAVAAQNPDAWLRTALTPADVATTSDDNRPVADPYPKLMTANIDVDQGGAAIVCSAAAAEAAGVPRERWTFVWSGAAGSDPRPSERWALDESPALRLSGERALALAGLGIDDCALLDLYSCFPSAVQVAQRELRIAPDRPWTITGGLTFAAGPLHCYCMLALVRAVNLLRDQPEQRAFLTGNGGYLSKHSALVVSGQPASHAFRSEHPQHELDLFPRRPTPTGPPQGAVTVEATTTTYARSGEAQHTINAVLDEHGTRHFVG
jgi:acetyl-CoA C-acetyltransferase